MKLKLMRGQVVVRELDNQDSAVLYMPYGNPRERKTHRGEVLAMGAPALYKGSEVPHGFAVGDIVQYHFSHNQKAWTMPWTDGLQATWIPQQNVDMVYEKEFDA